MAHLATLQAQFNFDLGSKGHVSLNFEATNHFIIMDVKFGNVLPLRFIFDTGSEHTLLFKKEYADLLGIQYDRKIPLMGSDLSQEVYGYIARGVSLKIAGVYTSKTDILVLEEDYLKLEESTGVKIDGIIGANVFKFFVLTVNNRKNKIQFHQAEKHSHPKSYKEVPVLIYKNKPYIDSKMTMSNEKLSVRLLLDTGAGLPILLYTNTADYLKLPEKTIRGTLGSGLGGHLEGYIGRVEHFSFEDFEFDNVLSSFQEVPADSVTRMGLERNGIVGNSILSRFNYVIDYPHQKLYMKARDGSNVNSIMIKAVSIWQQPGTILKISSFKECNSIHLPMMKDFAKEMSFGRSKEFLFHFIR
ncbi:MAG: aspartyl protease family protein [Saprospiraceae bacterium]|nr:aspartyl protease family protein [Saprospiraceae bacterium]